MLDRQKIKEQLDNGKKPIYVAFELGFLACLESVKDKGYESLASVLQKELEKIKE